MPTPFCRWPTTASDRFHLVMDVIDRVPGLAESAGHVRQLMTDKRLYCRAWTRQEGEDAPEIASWRWVPVSAAGIRADGRVAGAAARWRRGGGGIPAPAR